MQASSFKHIYNRPWKHLLAAIMGFVICYGLVSLAIDTGNLITYAGAVGFLAYSIKHAIGAVRKS